jgi:hypothetical protein
VHLPKVVLFAGRCALLCRGNLCPWSGDATGCRCIAKSVSNTQLLPLGGPFSSCSHSSVKGVPHVALKLHVMDAASSQCPSDTHIHASRRLPCLHAPCS